MVDFSKDFAIFILSHNRAHKIDTLKMVMKSNYKWAWFVVISVDNTQIEQYKEIVPKENLLIFDKHDIEVDMMKSTNGEVFGAATYARNFILNYASERYKYFLMIDDDISDVRFKMDVDGKTKDKLATNCLSEILEGIVEYLDGSDKLACIGLANSDAHFGGIRAFSTVDRDVQQAMLFKSSNVRMFRGLIWEDAILSTDNFDLVYLTLKRVYVQSPVMGKGSVVEYNKDKTPAAWYWFMVAPTAVKITGPMSRLSVNKYLYPKIINEEFKKL